MGKITRTTSRRAIFWRPSAAAVRALSRSGCAGWISGQRQRFRDNLFIYHDGAVYRSVDPEPFVWPANLSTKVFLIGLMVMGWLVLRGRALGLHKGFILALGAVAATSALEWTTRRGGELACVVFALLLVSLNAERLARAPFEQKRWRETLDAAPAGQPGSGPDQSDALVHHSTASRIVPPALGRAEYLTGHMDRCVSYEEQFRDTTQMRNRRCRPDGPHGHYRVARSWPSGRHLRTRRSHRRHVRRLRFRRVANRALLPLHLQDRSSAARTP